MGAPRRPAHLLLSIHSPVQQPLCQSARERDPLSASKRGSGAKLVQTELICRSEAIGAAWESRYSFCQFACWLPMRDLEVNFQQTQFITARRGFRRAPTLRQSPFSTPNHTMPCSSKNTTQSATACCCPQASHTISAWVVGKTSASCVTSPEPRRL